MSRLEVLIGNSKVSLGDLRVAIVHYWLLAYAGVEREIAALLEVFPQADLFVLVADEKIAARFAPHRVTTSFLQRLPGGRRFYRHLLPLNPFALEQFDLRGYDVVISIESGPAKGVITSPSTCHINYCNSPMRYIWDMYHDYVNGKEMRGLTRLIFKPVAHYMRLWDLASASRVDYFIANSNYIGRRIRKTYRRDSAVIYPPVEVASGYVAERTEDYYLVVGRLVDYKRVDLAVEACDRLKRRLRVVGMGPQYSRLKKIAGSSVEFLGNLSEEQKNEQYAHCRALLFPAEEDFGIVPVEAHSFGRPVIAFGRGGALETVRGPFAGEETIDSSCDGIFFAEQTAESLVDAMLVFEASEHTFSPTEIARNSARFSTERFKREMADFIAAHVREFRGMSERRPETVFH
jgi:glycosyltransferase involved in cell wall biosynthesis